MTIIVYIYGSFVRGFCGWVCLRFWALVWGRVKFWRVLGRLVWGFWLAGFGCEKYGVFILRLRWTGICGGVYEKRHTVARLLPPDAGRAGAYMPPRENNT